jgi:hypothetical protein
MAAVALMRLRHHQRALGACEDVFEGKDSPRVVFGAFSHGERAEYARNKASQLTTGVTSSLGLN